MVDTVFSDLIMRGSVSTHEYNNSRNKSVHLIYEIYF